MPMIDTRRDTGYFVRDLVQPPSTRNVLAYGSIISCKDYMAFWARIPKPFGGYYKQITIDQFDRLASGGLGRDSVDGRAYQGGFGHDGVDPSTVHLQDVSRSARLGVSPQSRRSLSAGQLIA